MAAHLAFALSTVLLVLVADRMLHAQGPLTEEQKAAWKDLNPDMSLAKVARVNEEFPMSDQENSAKWDPNLAMSDEFNGRKLDDSKWWTTNPDWKGREPEWFDPRQRVGERRLPAAHHAPGRAPPELKEKGYHTYATAAVKSKDPMISTVPLSAPVRTPIGINRST